MSFKNVRYDSQKTVSKHLNIWKKSTFVKKIDRYIQEPLCNRDLAYRISDLIDEYI